MFPPVQDEHYNTTYKAGFVHLVGKPNAGKSTLFNALIEFPLSIATHKPQTTRHNIIGIDQGEDHQVVYVDTPGYLEPAYELQKTMMRNVNRALVESDILLWLVDIDDGEMSTFYYDNLKKHSLQTWVILTKSDLIPTEEFPATMASWQKALEGMTVLPLCSLDKIQVGALSKKIVAALPIHSPYYDDNTLTDRPDRFFAAEIMRKALFLTYREEIPYSAEVKIEHFQEKGSVIVIDATIYVERQSQKRIVIGVKGIGLKRAGTRARRDMEDFFKKKVFLSQRVKVAPDWRKKKEILAAWGYK